MAERWTTASGSTVEVSGAHRGIWTVEFDWFEEGACYEARLSPVPDLAEGDERLTWSCDCCGTGSARLRPVADAPEASPGQVHGTQV